MSMDANTANVVTAAIAALPSIIGLLKSSHANANPGAPELTEAQALAALEAAVAASLAEDARLREQPAPAPIGDVHGSTGE